MAEILKTLFKAKPKTVLNVGGATKNIPLPPMFAGYQHLLLDIDPRGQPDVLGDARELRKLGANRFDAVYCSHNLEHFYYHEVPIVLEGMFHVIKPGGLVYIRVPDILGAIDQMRAKGFNDLEDGLYNASGTMIMTLDVIYGWSKEIESSGQPYYAHKTAFTERSLRRKLEEVGFVINNFKATNIEFQIIGKKP